MLTTVKIAHITPVCCDFRDFTAAIAHNFLKLQEKDRLKMLAQFLPERSEHAFRSKFDGQELNVAVAAWTVILRALLSNRN